MASTLNSLGSLYRARLEFNAAEPLYRRALEIREAAFGPAHPLVAETLNNMAALYRAEGRTEEADQLYRRALTIFKTTLGEEHPDVTATAEDYAALRRETERKAAPVNSLFLSDREIEQISVALLGGPEEDFAGPGAPARNSFGAADEGPRLMAWLSGALPPEPQTVVAAETEPVKKAPTIYGPQVLYLSSIIYFSPESWNFWLNGERITPKHDLANVDVVAVSRDAVDLVLHVASNKPAVPVRLSPNQTFVARTGETLEGRPPASLAGYSQATQ